MKNTTGLYKHQRDNQGKRQKLSAASPKSVVIARVKRRIPNAGAELSAMWGWRIMDYTDQRNPIPLNRGCKTEAAAWKSLDHRGVVR